jgi:hypothetical protein
MIRPVKWWSMAKDATLGARGSLPPRGHGQQLISTHHSQPIGRFKTLDPS